MANLKITGFGEEYTEKTYPYRGRLKVSFEKAAHLFVNSIIGPAARSHRLSDSHVNKVELKDGTVINEFELKLVRSLPTPTATTPGLYYDVKNIALGSSSSDISIRITRSGNQLSIETTGFDGCFMTTTEFGKTLRAYLGVKE
ncbi:MAG: hypothetical protein Q4D57_02300 [Clostridia bacterium]|nr:hypothetical protein [Clostridia bacterium]